MLTMKPKKQNPMVWEEQNIARLRQLPAPHPGPLGRRPPQPRVHVILIPSSGLETRC